MTDDRSVMGDDEFDYNNDYESEGGADDWYNDGHEGGTHSEDNLYSGIIFWIFCIAFAAATIIKPPSAK